MADKAQQARMKRFAQAFKDARDRGANESDTVMYLVKFFEEVLGYDSLAGEIAKEVNIKERYCDLALKIDGETQCLVEAKAAGNKGLRDRDIEQAENYASRHGIPWVVLTNGIEWQLYHLSFSEGEGEGIVHELAFEFNFIELIESDPDKLISLVTLISKESFTNDTLDDFWSHKKILSPASLVRVLFNESTLTIIRRELNRSAEVRLDMEDVFNAVKEALSKDALMAAGDITLTKHRRKKRKVHKDSTAPTPADEINPVSNAIPGQPPAVNAQQASNKPL